jgi:hypothetical protein
MVQGLPSPPMPARRRISCGIDHILTTADTAGLIPRVSLGLAGEANRRSYPLLPRHLERPRVLQQRVQHLLREQHVGHVLAALRWGGVGLPTSRRVQIPTIGGARSQERGGRPSNGVLCHVRQRHGRGSCLKIPGTTLTLSARTPALLQQSRPCPLDGGSVRPFCPNALLGLASETNLESHLFDNLKGPA